MSAALKESILRALGRGQELTLGEIVRSVRNDYGRVADRTVLRYLAYLAKWEFVRRDGVRGHFVYARVKEAA